MYRSKKNVFRSALDYDARSLALCLEKIAEQKRLLLIVTTALPKSIAEHADHCVISGNRLLIYTASAAWASQIRFFSQAILNSLHELGQQKIVRIQVKVLLQAGDAKRERTVCLPSNETVEAIFSQVDEKSEDVLDKALTKLANTLKKRLES
ncbi:MAG: DciA family protein [Methylomonas sp.]|nr:DciA family protein [Methylomonas sp.]